MRRILYIVALIAVFSGITYALDCATNAYSQSCNVCTFDYHGKMDPGCSNAWTQYGQKCIAEKRPYLAYRYDQGTCPEVQKCAEELTSCKNAVSTGNDKLDCLNPAVGQCFVEADACVKAADEKCGNDNLSFIDGLMSECPFPVILILLPVLGLYYRRNTV